MTRWRRSGTPARPAIRRFWSLTSVMRPSLAPELWVVVIPWTTACRSSRQAPAAPASGASPAVGEFVEPRCQSGDVAVVEHGGQPADQVVGVPQFRAVAEEPVQAVGGMEARLSGPVVIQRAVSRGDGGRSRGWSRAARAAGVRRPSSHAGSAPDSPCRGVPRAGPSRCVRPRPSVVAGSRGRGPGWRACGAGAVSLPARCGRGGTCAPCGGPGRAPAPRRCSCGWCRPGRARPRTASWHAARPGCPRLCPRRSPRPVPARPLQPAGRLGTGSRGERRRRLGRGGAGPATEYWWAVGEVPAEQGPFPTAPSQNDACEFHRMSLSSDYSVSAGTGFLPWMPA